MNLGDPSDVGLAQVPARILTALAATSGAMTVRQLARASGTSLARTQHWVHHWADRGVILQQQAGRSLMCSLNRAHLMTASLVTLANARNTMIECIRSEVVNWSIQPRTVAAFGSFARGDGDVDSDIDVLVIFDTQDLDGWHEQLGASAERLGTQFGNRIEWYDLNLPTWHRMIRDGEPLVAELQRDVIHIFGEYLSLLPTGSDTR